MDLDSWCTPKRIPSGSGSGTGGRIAVSGGMGEDEALTICLIGPDAPWQYRWPDGSITRYEQSWRYAVARGDTTWCVSVACARRTVYSALRGHITVFKRLGRQQAESGKRKVYPWVSFVESDLDSYCAIIPTAAKVKSRLTAGNPLPARFSEQRVERADRLFHDRRNAPSLRLVVAADDYISMIEHAVWVAGVREKL